MNDSTYPLRAGLPELPPKIKALPVDERGYPVPWFVSWIDGKPDFRVIEPGRLAMAIRHQRCWICGEPLGKFIAFVLGPMCAVNRISSEPPSHLDCATFAAKACPFLTLPKAVRREANMPANTREPPGVFLQRNPGVSLIWVTREFKTTRVDHGVLFRLGAATSVYWYAYGRPATRAEVLASIESGLPALRELAEADGQSAALQRSIDAVNPLLPKWES